MNATTHSFRLSSSDTNAPVFLATGKWGNLTTGYACFPVVVAINQQVRQVLPAEASTAAPFSSRRGRIEANPRRAAAVAAARQRLGEWIEQEAPLDQPQALAALRLRAGLSQAQLAERLKTSQPNIARFEKSPDNPTLDSIKAWADALGVGVMEIIQAIEATTSKRAS